MKKYIIASFLLTLTSCSSFKDGANQAESLHLQNVSLKAGEVKLITYAYDNISNKTHFACKWGDFPAYYENGLYYSYIAESYFTQFEDYTCDLVQDGISRGVALNVMVSDRPFPIETLRVNPRKVILAPDDLARVKKEQLMLNEIYANSSSVPLFSRPFTLPLDSKITSHYGVKRIFNGMKKGQHLGTDFRAATGVKIPVANSGRVVFSGDLFYTGNTVIIDHGMKIFSVYGHMSRIHASAGEYVPQGAIIGRSGSTGRSTGPHLHWGVKISGHYIDGSSLVKETQFLAPVGTISGI